MGRSETTELLKTGGKVISGQDSTLTSHEMFQTLISMLSVELTLCRQLRDLVVEKQQVIIAGNVEQLDQITGKEGRLAKVLGDKVKERAGLMNHIAVSYGLELAEPRLSYLMALVPPDLASRLSQLIEQTGAAAHQITETNQQNEFLIKASMDYARGMINLLYHHQGQEMALYDTRGLTDKRAADTRLLDRKA